MCHAWKTNLTILQQVVAALEKGLIFDAEQSWSQARTHYEAYVSPPSEAIPRVLLVNFLAVRADLGHILLKQCSRDSESLSKETLSILRHQPPVSW